MKTAQPSYNAVAAKSTQRFYGPSMKQSGALSGANNNVSVAPRAKTLGWFMAESDLFEKKKTASSDESNEKSRVIGATAIGDERKKQKRLRKTMSSQGAARKDSYAGSQAMSESSEEGYEEKRVNSLLADMTLTHQTATTKNSTSSTTSSVSADEYWFYDVASDGYYYEQNGAKGWRRRMPNMSLQKKEDSQMNSAKYNLMAQAAAAAQAQALLQQALLQQQQQPAMRYYDANSDGFYYEMASVDGWKRRQPNKPLSASVPAGITRPYAVRQAEKQMQNHNGMGMSQTSSYGAALARGQMPRNCVIDESSASSSICGENLQDFFGTYDQMYPSISRPNALNLDSAKQSGGQINPNFNADQFIRDLSFSGLGHSKLFGMRTPETNSWSQVARGCSLWSQSPAKSTAAVEDEANMHDLLKDIEKIWAAPTPVSNNA